jgi:O-acetyl-ADP-ribose deacetylase (regulator of RNase III)
MQVPVHQSLLELVQGDITRQNTDAIVNAANSSLLGGGGVDGAIHRAGGPAILEACRKLDRPCPTGEARITTGGALLAQYVIHAVGPIYRDYSPQEAFVLLGKAYRSSLELAVQHGVRRLAFPSISTGAYGYPLQEAAPIALRTVVAYLHKHPEIELVRFVLFDAATFAAYQHALQDMTGTS